jgi:membrane protein YqaA with SNARE-associated domain
MKWETFLVVLAMLGIFLTIGIVILLDIAEQQTPTIYRGLGEIVKVYGLAGVFILTYIGSTLVPFPIDTFFAISLKLSEVPLFIVLATIIAYVFGALTNFYLAKLLREKWVEKHVKKSTLEKTSKWFNKYGILSLLIFGLLPIPLFDPITFMAGLSGMNEKKFVILVGLSKTIYFTTWALIILKIL